MKKNHVISVCVIGVCLVSIVLMYIAAKKALFDLEENGCEMTYMFEYPEYIRIKLKKKLSENYPRYALYLYGEGDYADELRRSNPSGIPVLFIPGNAGSYRQVRSLASVALRKAESHTNHFNYFTIDFDEDFSGLYGGVLMDQVNFVNSCLRHIIRMYKGNAFTPESVIVIGHSMGGMIARALFTLENFQSRVVSIIITLGTPHVAPVIAFDSHLNTFYLKVNDFWKNNPIARNVSVISLAGGARDILVPARYCSLPLRDTALQYGAVTTAVPETWLTIDHLALCWCKQLILVINRALFTLIDKDTNRITSDKTQQKRVLRQYFTTFNEQNEETLQKSRIRHSPTIYNETNLWNHFEEIAISGNLLIPVDTRNDAQFIALSNSFRYVSIKTCKRVEAHTCTDGKLISFQELPISKKKKTGFYLTKLTNISYIEVSSLKEKTGLAMQFLPRSHINKQFDNFRISSGVQRFFSSNNMFINISLPMIGTCFDVYLIVVEKINCENDHGGLFMGRIHFPWSQEDVYAGEELSTQFTILSKPQISNPTTASGFAQLHVWKSDQCSLQVTVEYQFAETLGQIFILQAPLIPHWIYIWIMIVLVIQLRHMSDEGVWISVWSIVTSTKLPWFLPLLTLLSGDFLLKVLRRSLGFPDVTSHLRVVDGLMFYEWLLPSCFTILTAFVIFLTLCIILEFILSCFSWLIILLCSSQHIESQREISTTATVLFYSFTGLVLISLINLCSSIAIYFLTMVNFIHCCKTSMKCRQLLSTNVVTTSVKFEVFNKLNLSKLLLVLSLVISFQTTPAFLVWLKVLPTSWYVPSDPFISLAVLLIPTLVCLLEMHVHKPPKYASYIVLIMSCVGFLLCSLDRLPCIIGCILLAVDFFAFVKYIKHEKNS